MPSLKDIEEIERIVKVLLPYPNGGTQGWAESYYSKLHETILFYARLPHGLELLQKKLKNHQYNIRRTQKGAATGELKYYMGLRDESL